MISRSHSVARRIRALRKDPGLRAAEGVLLAEGIHLAQEALAAGIAIELAVVAPSLAGLDEGRRLRDRLEAAGVRIEEASEATLEGLQDARSPQPILLVVGNPSRSAAEVLASARGVPLAVVACGVQDPGNLGTLLRTAAAAGATGFVATSGGASLHHPRTVRGSMGAIFTLPAAEAAPDHAMAAASAAGLRLVGADAHGDVPYDDVPWTAPTALLLGAEGAGLPADARARLDVRVRIPMAAGVESLSVGAAAAVLLFEAARARRGLSRAG